MDVVVKTSCLNSDIVNHKQTRSSASTWLTFTNGQDFLEQFTLFKYVCVFSFAENVLPVIL